MCLNVVTAKNTNYPFWTNGKVMILGVSLHNPIAFRKVKIVHNFGLSECNRVKHLRVCLYSSLGSIWVRQF